jgi:UDP-galactopyranose mutase
MDFNGLEYLVVGAGISGLTVAEHLRAVGCKVAVIERRAAIGGNCATYIDSETGIECHCYGTHVFHTSNARVWDYVCRFGNMNNYRHRVLIRHRGTTYPWPVNLQTINLFYGADSSPAEAAELLRVMTASSRLEPAASLREAAIGRMGLQMYKAFVHGYSLKQWGCDASALPAALAGRIPVRTNYNSDFFDDCNQGVPVAGYQALFANMARGVRIFCGIDYFDIRDQVPAGCQVIYTGPLDAYFGNRFGPLAWRGVRFDLSLQELPDYQGASVINYPDLAVDFTRVHEFKHLRPRDQRQSQQKTIVAHEYPDAFAEPAYPVAPDGPVAAKYRAAAMEADALFCGRLATYRYFNMDQAIAQALELAESITLNPKP